MLTSPRLAFCYHRPIFEVYTKTCQCRNLPGDALRRNSFLFLEGHRSPAAQWALMQRGWCWRSGFLESFVKYCLTTKGLSFSHLFALAGRFKEPILPIILDQATGAMTELLGAMEGPV